MGCDMDMETLPNSISRGLNPFQTRAEATNLDISH